MSEIRKGAGSHTMPDHQILECGDLRRGNDNPGCEATNLLLIKCFVLPSLAAIVVGLFFVLGTAHAASPRTLIAKVERVSDGDTLVAFSSNGTKLRIRLVGIDAPEASHGEKPGQPYGTQARDYLDHLIGGKTVRVDAYGPDKYKRVLAVVWDGQINVNLLMVAMGYAELYRGAPCQVHCRELEEAEAEARRDRVGMWAQGDKYEGPAEFRKRMRIRGD